jgi:hypothetical protein
LLNWAVRYFPIVRVLKKKLAPGDFVLEVGSGAYGLGTFYPHTYVGSDVKFAVPPRKPMLPVLCSAAQLPFADAAFPAVVASDVLEHVPPEYRETVIKEALRVAKKFAIFGFPSGEDAHLRDERFKAELLQRNSHTPDWLDEHLLYPFPEPVLFAGLGPGWSIEDFGNEKVSFHDWVDKRELSRYWLWLLRLALWCMPGLLEYFLKFADREPYYRRILIISRTSPEGAKAG